ncbi:FAD-binding domain-containing protein [Cubamyces lactineus]|nr:FAD-binding domain-containing protein [Cubamyces lactineus]
MPRVASLSVLLLVWLAGQFVHGFQESSPRCRCLYGDLCWPSEAEFAQLESELSRPLVMPTPLALPCYLATTPYTQSNSSSVCSTITANWDNGTFRSGHPGTMEAPNFETFITPAGQLHACFLNTTLGAQRCEQGSVPVVGVEAHTVNDIQVAVRFAARHNLRLVIKNTGHDYLGRSSGRDSFMIWTHHMKNITMHEAFRPSGSLSGEIFEHAITVHAGVQWQEAYNAANASGRMIVGGVAAGGSVGAAGGWVLGGGQSLVSPVYGLGVDNVLELALVLANGSHATTNAYEHPDLFWALRGGGGGTFGVVTSVTYKTYPIVPTVSASLVASANTTQSTLSGSLADAFTEFVRITPALTDAGWGGYVTYGPGTQGGLTYELVAIAPNLSWEEANATIVPYFDYVHALAENSTGSGTTETQLTVSVAETTLYPSFLSWYTANIPATGLVGSNLNLGSWLLPRDLVETDHKRVAETLSTVPGLSFEFVAGGAVSRTNASSTGLNPAWRKALVHTIFGVAWADGTSAAEIGEIQDTLKATSAKVRALAPDSGAYFNEASMFEPDPPKAFFGAHYEKLKTIKKTYDPMDLFLVLEGVGSDEWDRELRCKIH